MSMFLKKIISLYPLLLIFSRLSRRCLTRITHGRSHKNSSTLALTRFNDRIFDRPLRFSVGTPHLSQHDILYHTYFGIEYHYQVGATPMCWVNYSSPIHCGCRNQRLQTRFHRWVFCDSVEPASMSVRRRYSSKLLESLPYELLEFIRSYLDIRAVRFDSPFTCKDFFALAYLFGIPVSSLNNSLEA